MIKICLYGPESVGKTSMAKELSKCYDVRFVPEVAREMVFSSDFSVDDIIAIGKAQTNRVLEMESQNEKLLICDTDLITTQLYSQIYLHQIPEILYELEAQVQYDHYFLLDIDVPWVADGLRDLGDRRQEIFEVFRNALIDRQIDYTLVQGRWHARKKMVMAVLEEKFGITA
jgi:HTH-type transcriptional regulator, transcriptional repressor of NAD biosynthesis genes